MTSFDALLSAFHKAKRGKSRAPAVQAFGFDIERHLCDLQQSLREGVYRPGAYRQFKIYERKPRTISAAPFVDRVVHHALMAVIEPLLEQRLAPHCHACRKGRGVHRAVAHYQVAARRYQYALKLDIASYFASVDRGILKHDLTLLPVDQPLHQLAALIIDSAPTPEYAPAWSGADLVDMMQRQHGLPIGNLSSQHFANLYLNPIDHWLDKDPRVGAWLRYVDDIIVLADSKHDLWQLLRDLKVKLSARRLCVHARKCQLFRTRQGVEVLGCRVQPHRIRLRRDNGYRYRRHLRQLARAYSDGSVNLEQVRSSVAAWLGHTAHAQAQGLQKAVLAEVCFSRGASS